MTSVLFVCKGNNSYTVNTHVVCSYMTLQISVRGSHAQTSTWSRITESVMFLIVYNLYFCLINVQQ